MMSTEWVSLLRYMRYQLIFLWVENNGIRINVAEW